MRIALIISAFFVLTSFQSTSNDKSFYDYKGAGKLIGKLSGALVTDSTNFEFGFQSYSRHQIKSTTSFYNQPSDMLHYVLTTQEGRTLHFQVPMLQVAGFTVYEARNGQTPMLEVRCESGAAGVHLKEQNARGGIVFSVSHLTYQLPLPPGVNLKKLEKYSGKLLKKIEAYDA